MASQSAGGSFKDINCMRLNEFPHLLDAGELAASRWDVVAEAGRLLLTGRTGSSCASSRLRT